LAKAVEPNTNGECKNKPSKRSKGKEKKKRNEPPAEITRAGLSPAGKGGTEGPEWTAAWGRGEEKKGEVQSTIQLIRMLIHRGSSKPAELKKNEVKQKKTEKSREEVK